MTRRNRLILGIVVYLAYAMVAYAFLDYLDAPSSPHPGTEYPTEAVR